MAWTAEKVRALRESNPSETAKKDEESGKWTAERVRALRTSTPSQPADAAALRDQKQTEAANADTMSKAFDEYRANNNLGFAPALPKGEPLAGRVWPCWMNRARQGVKARAPR